MNFVIVGVIVLLVHDPGDVFLIIGRAYTDMKNRNVVVNVILAIIAYSVWVYTRNIVFTTCVLNSAYTELFAPRVVKLDEILYLPSVFMIFMLSSLAIMHAYWTFFLSKAAFIMISKGKDKNGYDSWNDLSKDHINMPSKWKIFCLFVTLFINLHCTLHNWFTSFTFNLANTISLNSLSLFLSQSSKLIVYCLIAIKKFEKVSLGNNIPLFR